MGVAHGSLHCCREAAKANPAVHRLIRLRLRRYRTPFGGTPEHAMVSSLALRVEVQSQPLRLLHHHWFLLLLRRRGRGRHAANRGGGRQIRGRHPHVLPVLLHSCRAPPPACLRLQSADHLVRVRVRVRLRLRL
eukprot:scaffold65150_cov67-Phaeocystis_antarctica.AAC.4